MQSRSSSKYSKPLRYTKQECKFSTQSSADHIDIPASNRWHNGRTTVTKRRTLKL